MTRFQKLAAATVATTFVLVVIGVVVRATDSGVGCPDWPLLPRPVPAGPRADPNVWIEWIHRAVAAFLIGVLVLAMPALALVDYRDRPSILWPSARRRSRSSAFQAWLGRETVRLGNSGESVTAHLATAMALLAVLIYILARSFFPARIGGRGA